MRGRSQRLDFRCFCSIVSMLCTHPAQLPACNVLIECGATVDQPAENCVTPLQLAAYVGNKEAVSLLLRKGATIGLKDSRVSRCCSCMNSRIRILYPCKKPFSNTHAPNMPHVLNIMLWYMRHTSIAHTL